MRLTALALGLAALAAAPAQAAPFYQSFGVLPEATFGGSGIPNDAVAITSADLGGGVTVTIGVTATERYFNPDVENDGAGTFFATTGYNNGFGSSSVLGATWNMGFYVGLSSGTFADLAPNIRIQLFYDANPSIQRSNGRIDLLESAAANGALGLSVLEGSQNLAFSFLNETPTFPGVYPHSVWDFDPLVAGLYGISLVVSDGGEGALARAAIDVVVETVPGPAGAVLLLSGLLVMGSRRRA